MAVVSVQNLKVDFGGKVLFENVSADECAAFCGFNFARYNLKKRGFTGSVCADESDEFTGIDGNLQQRQWNQCCGQVNQYQ